jgi:hypothetical protein
MYEAISRILSGRNVVPALLGAVQTPPRLLQNQIDSKRVCTLPLMLYAARSRALSLYRSLFRCLNYSPLIAQELQTLLRCTTESVVLHIVKQTLEPVVSFVTKVRLLNCAQCLQSAHSTRSSPRTRR